MNRFIQWASCFGAGTTLGATVGVVVALAMWDQFERGPGEWIPLFALVGAIPGSIFGAVTGTAMAVLARRQDTPLQTLKRLAIVSAVVLLGLGIVWFLYMLFLELETMFW